VSEINFDQLLEELGGTTGVAIVLWMDKSGNVSAKVKGNKFALIGVMETMKQTLINQHIESVER
jgi:hypothetical protein